MRLFSPRAKSALVVPPLPTHLPLIEAGEFSARVDAMADPGNRRTLLWFLSLLGSH